MTVLGLQIRPGRTWSRAIGKVAHLPLPQNISRAVVWTYSQLLNVQLGEVVVPEEGFRSLGEFFARTLKPELRPVDTSAKVIVVPCDGLFRDGGSLSIEGKPGFEVKGKVYSIDELMGGPGWWSQLDGGSYAVIYLSPADYHRVHSPVAGKVRQVWHLDGTSYPVNRFGQLIAPWSVVCNERVVFDIDGPVGRVAVVMVGAFGVRAIEVTLPGLEPGERWGVPDGGVQVARAEEIGVFHLGSTVVVFWEKSSQMTVRSGQSVRFGQRLASW